MSKLKRFVSSVATTAILLSATSVPSFAALSNDVIGSQYEEAAKVLGAFDIMVGDAGTGLFRPNDPIKRSEVTKVAVALKGLTNAANASTSTRFPDVAKDHWATGFINVGSSEGLIIGDDLGNFRPDDYITYAEATTILVRALGYEPQAQSKGGYPTGYLLTGNSTGLTSGVSVASARSTKAMTRGDVALMAYNSLNINLMEQTGFGSNTKYEIVDETLLTDKLDAKLVSGRVTAVGSSSLKGAGVEKGQIEIDGKIYDIGKSDVRNVLGLYVDAYIVDKTSSKDHNTLKVAIPSPGRNDITTILADDIDSITESSSSKVINYHEGNKKVKVTVPDSAMIVYNGKAASFDALKNIESGSIMIVDISKSEKIVFVNETQNYVVDEVSSKSNKVIDKYGKAPLTLDPEDESVTYVIEKDNKIIEAKDLKEWDVITLTMSSDKSIIYGNVIQSTVEGKVSEKTSEGVDINGKTYKVAKNYPYEISLSDEGVFYLDQEGKIAAFNEKDVEERNYAFISNIGVTAGFNSTLEIELFTSEGKVEQLNGAAKIKVDGRTYSNAAEALSAIGSKGQLVLFELNTKGEVSKIEKSISSSEIDEDEFVLNFTEDDVEYNSKTGKLNASEMSVRVDANTLVFDIPAGAKDSDEYSVTDKSFFSDGGKYNISVYDITEDLTAGVVIVTNSENKAGEEGSVVVVEKITTSKDENGDTVEKLYGYQSGERVSFTSDNEVFRKDGDKLEKGDIIQIKADSKGNAKAISVLFDIDEIDTEFSKEISKDLTVEYGKVTKKFASSFNLQVNDNANVNYAIGNAKIYVVDSEKKTNSITVGDASDIQKFDDAKPERVFVRVYKGEVMDIVVIR